MVKPVALDEKLELVADGVELAERVAPMLAEMRAVAESSQDETVERKALAKLYYRDGQAYAAASAIMGLARRQVTPRELMFLTEAIERLEEYAAANAIAAQIMGEVDGDDFGDLDDLENLKPMGGVN